MCGLFILQKLAMEGEHDTKPFYKIVRGARGNIYYFNTWELNKSVYGSKRCTLFTLFFKR